MSPRTIPATLLLMLNDSLLRLLLGIVVAGMWPGMAYYLTLFYPPSRTGKGLVCTSQPHKSRLPSLVSYRQVSRRWTASADLSVSMDVHMYGLVGILCGISLLWWLLTGLSHPEKCPLDGSF